MASHPSRTHSFSRSPLQITFLPQGTKGGHPVASIKPAGHQPDEVGPSHPNKSLTIFGHKSSQRLPPLKSARGGRPKLVRAAFFRHPRASSS